jgi:hypothetical protein
VVHLDQERATPKIWLPMVDGLDKADKFSFIGHQLGMVRHELLTEESNWPRVLM